LAGESGLRTTPFQRVGIQLWTDDGFWPINAGPAVLAGIRIFLELRYDSRRLKFRRRGAEMRFWKELMRAIKQPESEIRNHATVAGTVAGVLTGV
jgi:hypothetical protein